jgi:hypothetical protein
MRIRSVLFVRMTSGCAFVVPRNSVPVMALPVRVHANADGSSHDRFPLGSLCSIRAFVTGVPAVKPAGRV